MRPINSVFGIWFFFQSSPYGWTVLCVLLAYSLVKNVLLLLLAMFGLSCIYGLWWKRENDYSRRRVAGRSPVTSICLPNNKSRIIIIDILNVFCTASTNTNHNKSVYTTHTHTLAIGHNYIRNIWKITV